MSTGVKIHQSIILNELHRLLSEAPNNTITYSALCSQIKKFVDKKCQGYPTPKGWLNRLLTSHPGTFNIIHTKPEHGEFSVRLLHIGSTATSDQKTGDDTEIIIVQKIQSILRESPNYTMTGGALGNKMREFIQSEHLHYPTRHGWTKRLITARKDLFNIIDNTAKTGAYSVRLLEVRNPQPIQQNNSEHYSTINSSLSGYPAVNTAGQIPRSSSRGITITDQLDTVSKQAIENALTVSTRPRQVEVTKNETQSSGMNFKYFCDHPRCLMKFPRWQLCRNHIIETGHSQPDKGAQQRLSIVNSSTNIIVSPSVSSSSNAYPKWAYANAEQFIQAAFKHPVNVMEIIRQSKKQTERPAKEYKQHIIAIMQADPRIRTEQKSGQLLFTVHNQIARKNSIETSDTLNSISTYFDQISNSTSRQLLSAPEDELKPEFDRDNESEIDILPSHDDAIVRYVLDADDTLLQNNHSKGYSLGNRSTASRFIESAYIGKRSRSKELSQINQHQGSQEIYLNTHEPFCLATVGIQGAGKSHTMAVVLESCLLPIPHPHGRELIRLKRPMTALVLHYDQNVTSICESTGLICPQSKFINASQNSPFKFHLPPDRMIVLVSPTYYLQRKKFYGDYCIVKPLLFRWGQLSADHIKKLMRINEGDSQLYVASMLDLLRSYQRKGVLPAFEGFLKQVKSVCSIKSQTAPLEQRIALLQSIVAESSTNAELIKEGTDLFSSIAPGSLVVADLTDPLLSSEEANGIFQVLTEQFRAAPAPDGCGKLLALDEAHKFMDGVSTDGLSNAIVNAVRLMRHEGIRVIVSTQSPKALAPELLELVSVAVLHRFHSRDWFNYLRSKIPLPESSFDELIELHPGLAIIFASRHQLGTGELAIPVDIRNRITADRGSSKTNSNIIKSV